MKLLRLIVILLFFLQLNLAAQSQTQAFGKIFKTDFEVTLSSQDRNAEAVVIFDLGKSHFGEREGTYDVLFERKTRIKILSDAGLKWGEVKIPFYQEGGIYEEVEDIEAYVYNIEDGRLKKSKITESDWHDEVLNKSWKIRKFALPNVKIGSIIEYRYKIRSQYLYNLRDWKFQWRIPVKYSEYAVHLIPFYEYSWILQGADKFTSHERYESTYMPRQASFPGYTTVEFRDMIDKFVMKDVPAFNDEEFITSINDYIIKIDFQLSAIHKLNGSNFKISTTWPDFIKELLKEREFGKYVKKSKKLASKVLDVKNALSKSPEERFNYVLDYVKENFSWNKYNGKFASKSVKSFIKDKEGNCADVNLFVVGLLQAVGIDAKPVLISTRNHGLVKYEYPFRHYFNYVLVTADVDGKKILVDATDRNNSNYRLPINCINGKGLIISKGEVKLVNLSCRFPSNIMTKFEIDISDNNTKVDIEEWCTEYDALRFRSSYGDDKKLIKERLSKNGYNVIDSTIVVSNNKAYRKPYSLKYSVKETPEIHANKMYVAPFLDETIANNPLKQKTRKYPVDMVYPTTRTFNSKIVVPKGYKVDHLPENLKINNKLFSLNYNVSNEDKLVKISFSYSFKSSTYSAKFYQKVKYYFSQIVAKGNEKIVFVKN